MFSFFWQTGGLSLVIGSSDKRVKDQRSKTAVNVRDSKNSQGHTKSGIIEKLKIHTCTQIDQSFPDSGLISPGFQHLIQPPSKPHLLGGICCSRGEGKFGSNLSWIKSVLNFPILNFQHKTDIVETGQWKNIKQHLLSCYTRQIPQTQLPQLVFSSNDKSQI